MLMDPNYQPPTNSSPAPSGQFDSGQFDFIMNNGQKPKKGLLPSGSPKQRLLIIIIAAVVGLIAVVLIFVAIFSGGSSGTDQVVLLAKQQNEIIRVAGIGNTKAGGTEAKKLAAIVTSTITTDQTKTIAYLAQNGKKVKPKQLATSVNATTDSDLAAAERNGRFDEVFMRDLLQELKDYQAAMKTTYPSLGKTGQALLDQNNKNVVLILNDNSN